MKLISVITPCFNEEENVENIYNAIKEQFKKIAVYEYEHIFIDNASTDNTVGLIKKITNLDANVKLIINSRNFDWLRSPYYAMLQASGNAVIALSADLQDPPVLIPDFIKKWEEGFKIVVGVKSQSEEPKFLFFVRKLYYKLIKAISDVKIISNYTGFGLYDRSIIDIMGQFKDSRPFLRGIISEIGFDVAEVYYHQPIRQKGESKLKLYRLYDAGMLGIVNHSKLPLRIITFIGFGLSVLSLGISSVYLLLKLFFWKNFTMGLAPILIGSFFFFSFQMFLIGFLGEYILAIYTQVLNRPLVIERERINFIDT
jgi:polyisoprenyl-phosphate glycosyltransferase